MESMSNVCIFFKINLLTRLAWSVHSLGKGVSGEGTSETNWNCHTVP